MTTGLKILAKQLIIICSSFITHITHRSGFYVLSLILIKMFVTNKRRIKNTNCL